MKNLFILALIALAIGCGGGGGGATESGSDSQSSNLVTEVGARDAGDVSVQFLDSVSYSGIEDIAVGYFKEDVIENSLNNWVKLPKGDVTINFQDCGVPNAFYDSSQSMVIICYELLMDAYNLYALYYPSEQAESISVAITYFVLAHEVGHMLVDNLSLSLLGNEEVHADSIATVIMMGLNFPSAPIYAAEYFNYYSTSLWSDIHRHGANRYGDLTCWAIGGDPSLLDIDYLYYVYLDLVLSGRDCQAEFQHQKETLDYLLGPYLKDPNFPMPRNSTGV